MIAVVAIRMHELFPILAIIKPVFTLTIAGLLLLWRRSTPPVRGRLLRDPLARVDFLYFAFIVVTIPNALWSGRAFGIARGSFQRCSCSPPFSSARRNASISDRLQVGTVTLLLLYSAYAQFLGRSGRLA